jgi:SAM-dependent methyltransferase
MADNPASTYDEMPYMRRAFPQTHPDRLATLATIAGMSPPPIETGRVLELGSASGDNLIPMALGLPGARFVGIDLSQRQVDRARQSVGALGLTNIEFRHADLADIDASWGQYDYIIAHGVYSWVPEAVRDRLLAVCSGNLASNGVAFVSYNTYPGWRLREMVRDMMLYRAGRFEGAPAKVQQSRGLLEFLARAAAADSPYARVLQAELAALQEVPDEYLFHDHLEVVNVPVYFNQFAEAAQRRGLQYLGDADFSTMLRSNFPPDIAETLKSLAFDLISLEQYMDFVRNRTLRESLLVHSEVPLRRNLGGRALDSLYVASPARTETSGPSLAAGEIAQFKTPTGATRDVGDPLLKAAMLELAAQWPRGLAMRELAMAARARLEASGVPQPEIRYVDGQVSYLRDEMLRNYALGVVELHVWLPRFAATPSQRPKASALARLQAAEGSRVTNLRHELVKLDGVLRHFVELLDGTRDRAALAAAMVDKARSGMIAVAQSGRGASDGPALDQHVRRMNDENLLTLSRAALLVE